MLGIKKKDKPAAVPETTFQRAPAPEPPELPEAERAFFDILLEALAGGLLESEKELRKLAGREELLYKYSRLSGTVAYARALLHMEDMRREGLSGEPEEMELSALINLAVNGLRRSFLYSGAAVRRPEEGSAFAVCAPREPVLFLLTEMLSCCLRCAPAGRNLYINTRPIGDMLLLSLRSEGPSLQQSPLIPLLSKQEGGDAPEEDYGFAVCCSLAAHLGWALRWEADEAGVRMFLDIRN